MKIEDDIQIGKKVMVNSNKVLLDFMNDHKFKHIDIESLKTRCLLDDKKKYKIVNICRPCKTAKIQISKTKLVQIRFSQIEQLIS